MTLSGSYANTPKGNTPRTPHRVVLPPFLENSPPTCACFSRQAGERAASFGAARADPKTEAARGVSAGHGRRRHPGDQRERLDFE